MPHPTQSRLVSPLTTRAITADASHKPLWWRARGLAFDWASELARSTAADEVMVAWGQAIIADRD